MLTVNDPVIFVSFFLDRYPPGSAEDERALVLKQVDAFIERYKLEPYIPKERPYRRAAEIDLLHLANSTPEFEVLLQAHSEYPQSRTGAYYECMTYAYHDAVILYIVISKFKDWSGTILAGWDELTNDLRSVLDWTAFNTAQRSTLGLSIVYWAIANPESGIEDPEEQIRTISQNHDLRRTTTDLGAPLWHCERPLFRSCPTISQDLWMFVTPRSAEPFVNRRFNQPRFNSPSDFAIVALARHKIGCERHEYKKERERMRSVGGNLERRVREILDLQSDLGAELDELRSNNAVEFQRKLAAAGSVLADYRQSVGLLKELRRTVVINQRNFLINSVALISEHGAKEVARSIDQESAAARFLAKSQRDEIFSSQLSAFQGLCRQLDSDIDYADSLTERHTASLQSAGEQLRIAGERELGEMAHHLAVDSAAVVASIVAVIATEMILRPLESHQQEAFGRWSLTLALVVGSFALTQILSSGCRGKLLERWSAAIAAGLFGVFLANRYVTVERFSFLYHPYRFHLHEIAALTAGMLLGWFGHLRLKKYRTGSTEQREAAPR